MGIFYGIFAFALEAFDMGFVSSLDTTKHGSRSFRENIPATRFDEMLFDKGQARGSRGRAWLKQKTGNLGEGEGRSYRHRAIDLSEI